MDEELAALRRPYRGTRLRPEDLAAHPAPQLRAWLREARDAAQAEPNAAALATVDAEGRPAVRMVLVKGVSEAGVSFFTNYGSRKARELAANPHAALCLWWDRLERQVRVEGPVARLDDEANDAYFARRPRGSQLAAWASEQSAPLPDREALTSRLEALRARYPEGSPVPRPPHWGGYRLRFEAAELWQGGEDRLHDRFRYERDGDGWTVTRLAP